MQRLSIESHGGNEEFSQLLDVTEDMLKKGSIELYLAILVDRPVMLDKE